MIEVIYKEEKQEAAGNEGVFSIPRNIRQIGLISEDYRIYMEDYVYTFLGRFAQSGRNAENGKGCLAVLTGDTKWAEGITYVFVRGALAAEGAEAAADHIDLSEEIWTKIHEEGERYFSGQEVVGWFFAQPELPMASTEVLKRTHLKHFGGGEKVLMLMDPVEREDAFFRYENGFLVKQEGYYIFYEKNPLMQTYMMEKNQDIRIGAAEEVPDEAVKAFRKIIRGKGTEKPEETEARPSVFSYAATACLVIAVLAVGGNFYKNYREMRIADTKTSAVSTILEESEQEKKAQPAVTAVPTRKAKPTVTPAPKRTVTPTPSPAPVQEPETPKESEAIQKQSEQTKKTEQSQAQSRIYQEESDLRKANRKQAALAEEQEVSGTEVKNSYVIRPGDTLYQISIEKYGSMDKIEEICRLNGLSAEEIIYPGQIIVLP